MSINGILRRIGSEVDSDFLELFLVSEHVLEAGQRALVLNALLLGHALVPIESFVITDFFDVIHRRHSVFLVLQLYQLFLRELRVGLPEYIGRFLLKCAA